MSRTAHPLPSSADGLAIAVRARGGPRRPPPTHPCASCGLCCHTYVVPLSGADLYRIVRSLDLAPGDVSIAWRETDPGPDRFRLEPDGPLHSLALEKRTWSSQRSPCVFLMRLPGGQDRCGIYGLRPAACRAYPMLNVKGAVALRDDPLCPPRAWPVDEPGRPGWRDALQRARMDFDVYGLVVEAWNRRLGTARPLAAYHDYVLATYDRVAALEKGMGEPALGQLRASWRTPPRPGESVAHLPWQAHLDRIRALLANADG